VTVFGFYFLARAACGRYWRFALAVFVFKVRGFIFIKPLTLKTKESQIPAGIVGFRESSYYKPCGRSTRCGLTRSPVPKTFSLKKSIFF
jgi:hypothetical protein